MITVSFLFVLVWVRTLDCEMNISIIPQSVIHTCAVQLTVDVQTYKPFLSYFTSWLKQLVTHLCSISLHICVVEDHVNWFTTHTESELWRKKMNLSLVPSVLKTVILKTFQIHPGGPEWALWRGCTVDTPRCSVIMSWTSPLKSN